MFSLPRLLVACVVGASSLHVVDDVMGDERRVLIFGCSLDRNAVKSWCFGRNNKPAYVSQTPMETAWCFNPDLNVRLGYLFHPGVGLNGDLHKPTAIAKGLSTDQILKNHANATSSIMLKADPHMVVVDSSLWDLLVWRLGTLLGAGGPIPEPREVTEERVQQWCEHDLKKLLGHVSFYFPKSRVVFRTAPTIDHTPHFEKFEKKDIELLYKCISSSTTNGKLFGEYEIIDYHAIVQKLIDHNLPDMFRDDGYHPGAYPSLLYVNEIMRRVGVNVQDPPEPQPNMGRRAAAKAEFETAIQGDSNDLDLI